MKPNTMSADVRQALRIESEAFPDHVLLRLEGELDRDSVSELSAALDAARLSVGKVVIDMSGVSFINSAGVRSVAVAHRAGLTIAVRKPSRIGKRVFDVTGVTGTLVTSCDRPASVDPGPRDHLR